MNLNENQYELIVEFSPNLIWRSGTDGLCNYFNKTWLQFTGRSKKQENGNGWTEGVHPDDLAMCMETYTSAFAKQEPFEMVYRLRRHDGQYRWLNDRGVPFYDQQNIFLGYIGSCMDTTDQVIGEQLKDMAQIDGLTGVLSRQYFYQQAGEEFERAVRFGQNLCIAMIDIDHFKDINDQHGHQIGDQVLNHFAQTLSKNVRKFDLVGRYGGDEFIVLFANTDLIQANKAMQRLAQQLETPIELPDHISLATSFSLGFAVMQQDATLDNLIHIADQTMYKMKKSK